MRAEQVEQRGDDALRPELCRSASSS